MRKLLYISALLTLLITGLTACSDDDPDRFEHMTGDPIRLHKVTGELTNDPENGVFYFRAIECDDTYVLRKIGVLPKPIYKRSANSQRDILLANLGYVQLDVVDDELEDSLFVSFVKAVDVISRGIDECSTPELDTPPPAWFFKQQY